MKKVLSFILVLSMVLGSFGMAFAAPVATSDIAGHENEAAIQRLSKLGLVKGYEDGSFQPEKTITRAEFAVMLVRALGLESSANLAKGDTQFTDVTVASGYEWATGAINVASRLGYINGYGNGKFGPADQIRYEDAVTMIVRALGYEPAAQAKGGYPVGYLVVAEQDLDLTDNTAVTAGTAATRGTVFQMLDNALTEPMMVQVGYGDKAEYEVKEDKTLLGQLGYTTVNHARIVDFDADDLQVVYNLENSKGEIVTKGHVLEVEEDFDFEASLGLKFTLWHDKDDVVVAYEAKDEALFDALEITEVENTDELTEIKLIDADKKYDVDEDVVIFMNGTSLEFDDFATSNVGDVYTYAKVVLNSKNDVIFINAYEVEDFMVVEEVKDEVVFGQKDELDLEDFTIVKEGKTISADELEEGDILFYNNTEEYAEVFNNSVEGKISNVFSDSFTVNKKDYDIVGEIIVDALYYDSETEDYDTLDVDVLEQMEEEGKEVEVFLARNGDVVLVAGVRGEAVTTKISGILTSDLIVYEQRGNNYFAIDMVNNEGKSVAYDVRAKDVDVKNDGTADATDYTSGNHAAIAKIGEVVELEIDEDGKVEEINTLTTEGIKDNGTDAVKLTSKYIDSYRFKSNTVVYLLDGETYKIAEVDNGTITEIKSKDVKVTTWADVEDFKELDQAIVYSDKGYVEYLVVAQEDTDKDADTTSVTVFVTDVRLNNSGKLVRLTGFVNGEKVTYTVDSLNDAVATNLVEKDIVVIKVTDDGLVKEVKEVATDLIDTNLTITKISTKDGVITVTGTVYGGSELELVNKTNVYKFSNSKAINLRDLTIGDTVDVILDRAGNDRMIKMIILK